MTTPTRLYLITPAKIDLAQFPQHLEHALKGGDVACLQLRLKDCSDDDIRKATKILMPIAHRYDVAFLINDRPDLAAELQTDGVHIGQDDMSYDEARRFVGDDAIVGVTCHDSKHLAMVAGEKGADYVAFGAFFDTPTKDAKARAIPDILSWWSELFEIPCVAIGGITHDNCPALITAGADFLAVCGSIWNDPRGPHDAVAIFNQKIAKHQTP